MVYWWFIIKLYLTHICNWFLFVWDDTSKNSTLQKNPVTQYFGSVVKQIKFHYSKIEYPSGSLQALHSFSAVWGGIKSRIFNEVINYLTILHAILPFLCLLFTESLKEEIMTSGIVDIARQLSCHEEEKVREAANTFVAVLEEAPLERWTEKSTKMYRTSEWLSLCCWVEIRQTEIEWVLMPKCETWTPASKEHL